MYVYIIASSADTVKIGYSADPEKRLSQLQVGHERKLELVHKEFVGETQAPILEKLIHRDMRHRCIHGEWFKVTHSEAVLMVKFAVIRYGDDT